MMESRVSAKRFLITLSACILALSASPLAAQAVGDDVAILLDRGDDKTAFERAQSSSYAGNAEGHEMLAWFYDTGTIVDQDAARAFALYSQAAQAGRAHAQWRIGVMLDEQIGVAEARPDEAVIWFLAAAKQDYAKAWTSLGVMYATGRGVELDYAQSLNAYMQAATLGEAHGYYGVGILFALGQGVEADPVEAAAWMMVAHYEGDELAEAALGQLLQSLEGGDHQRIEQRALQLSEDINASRIADETLQKARYQTILG